MPAFETLDWRRPDVCAVVNGRGLLTVSQSNLPDMTAWLVAQGYVIWPLDFGAGIGPAVEALGIHCNWLEMFGYKLGANSRNLDALRDGVTSLISPANGLAIVLRRFEQAWDEDTGWSKGLLSILSEHSLGELAVGRRFFAVAEADSLVGQAYEVLSLGCSQDAPPDKGRPQGNDEAF